MEISRILVAASAFLLMVSVATAPDPRHPLSQITPVDTNLNMENYAVSNLSELKLNNGIGNTGLVFNDFRITHEGDQQKFILDYSNDEWDIQNSDLNLNDNDITNVDQLTIPDSGDAAGKNLLQIGDDAYLSDVDTSNTIGFQGIQNNGAVNLQLGSSGPTISGDSSTGDLGFSGSLDLNSNNIHSANQVNASEGKYSTRLRVPVGTDAY